jgi:hypothetical protein
VLAPDAQTDAAIQEVVDSLKRVFQSGTDAPTNDLQAVYYAQIGVGLWVKTENGWEAA